jgi:hypothetical protein
MSEYEISVWSNILLDELIADRPVKRFPGVSVAL